MGTRTKRRRIRYRRVLERRTNHTTIQQMKTVYPQEPIKDFEEWREYIRQQVMTAKERQVIEKYKQSIIKAHGR